MQKTPLAAWTANNSKELVDFLARNKDIFSRSDNILIIFKYFQNKDIGSRQKRASRDGKIRSGRTGAIRQEASNKNCAGEFSKKYWKKAKRANQAKSKVRLRLSSARKSIFFLIKNSRAKMSEIQAARDAAKPLDKRQGEMSAEDLNMDMHDPDFRAPDFPKRK